MLSYHNDPKVKEKYIARFAAHRAADEVIQGTGFKDGRGCFVGCTLDNYDHSRFPVELGWPEWLAHLADAIFEGLPKAEAAQFGTDLLEAVPVGVDLEPVQHLLAICRLKRVRRIVEGLPEADYIPAVLSAIGGVLRLHEAAAAGNVRSVWEWEAARSAAWSAAAWSAAAAAAAWSAAAEAAAWSAARSAAWSASAEAAAWSAAYKQERDDLLEILRGMGGKI